MYSNTTIDGVKGILEFVREAPLTAYGFSYRYPITWYLTASEQKKYGQLDMDPAARKAIDYDIAHGFITVELC